MAALNTASFNRTLQTVFETSKKVQARSLKDGDIVIVKALHEKYGTPLFNVCSVRCIGRFGKGEFRVFLATGQYDYPLNQVEFEVKLGEELVVLNPQPEVNVEDETDWGKVSLEEQA